MPTPRPHARVLARLRRVWEEYLTETGSRLTEHSAEDFLAAAHDALASLADELRAQLRLGVATEVRVFQEEGHWYVAVYFQDRRAKRCGLGDYVPMPDNPSEDDLRGAVVEVAFVHNVDVPPYEVQVDAADRFASWREHDSGR